MYLKEEMNYFLIFLAIAVIGLFSFDLMNADITGQTSHFTTSIQPTNNAYFTCTDFLGWVCDADDYDKSVEVNIYAKKPKDQPGTMHLGTLTANLQYSDVQNIPLMNMFGDENMVRSRCGGTANHYFKLPVPEVLKDERKQDIYFYYTDIFAKDTVVQPNIPPHGYRLVCASSDVQTALDNREAPGKIEAEDFDVRKYEDDAYYDRSIINEGGAYRPNVEVDIYQGGTNNYVAMADKEWMNYLIDVQQTGLYKIDFTEKHMVISNQWGTLNAFLKFSIRDYDEFANLATLDLGPETTNFQIKSITIPLLEGKQQISIEAFNNLFTHVLDLDNFQFIFQRPIKVDVSVEDVLFLDGKTDTGINFLPLKETMKLKITLKNQGEIRTGKITTKITMRKPDGEEILFNVFKGPSIAENQEHNMISRSFSFYNEPGQYCFEVKTDTENQLPEKDVDDTDLESNNAKQKCIEVKPLPDLIVDQLSFVHHPIIDGIGKVRTLIKNQGTLDAGTSTTSIKVRKPDGNEVSLGILDTPVLSIGASSPELKTTNTITFDQKGQYCVIAEADEGKIVEEATPGTEQETNNRKEQCFTAQAPYGTNPFAIPGRIEAVQVDEGGMHVSHLAILPTEPTGIATQRARWLEYFVDITPGNYEVYTVMNGHMFQLELQMANLVDTPDGRIKQYHPLFLKHYFSVLWGTGFSEFTTLIHQAYLGKYFFTEAGRKILRLKIQDDMQPANHFNRIHALIFKQISAYTSFDHFADRAVPPPKFPLRTATGEISQHQYMYAANFDDPGISLGFKDSSPEHNPLFYTRCNANKNTRYCVEVDKDPTYNQRTVSWLGESKDSEEFLEYTFEIEQEGFYDFGIEARRLIQGYNFLNLDLWEIADNQKINYQKIRENLKVENTGYGNIFTPGAYLKKGVYLLRIQFPPTQEYDGPVLFEKIHILRRTSPLILGTPIWRILKPVYTEYEFDTSGNVDFYCPLNTGICRTNQNRQYDYSYNGGFHGFECCTPQGINIKEEKTLTGGLNFEGDFFCPSSTVPCGAQRDVTRYAGAPTPFYTIVGLHCCKSPGFLYNINDKKEIEFPQVRPGTDSPSFISKICTFDENNDGKINSGQYLLPIDLPRILCGGNKQNGMPITKLYCCKSQDFGAPPTTSTMDLSLKEIKFINPEFENKIEFTYTLKIKKGDILYKIDPFLLQTFNPFPLIKIKAKKPDGTYLALTETEPKEQYQSISLSTIHSLLTADQTKEEYEITETIQTNEQFEVGKYCFDIEIGDQQIPEKDTENNNLLEHSCVEIPQPKPDLQIKDLGYFKLVTDEETGIKSYEPTFALELGDEVRIATKVQNPERGQAEAFTVEAELYKYNTKTYKGTTVFTQTLQLPLIPPSRKDQTPSYSDAQSTQSYKFVELGIYCIKAYADKEAKILETDKKNNFYDQLDKQKCLTVTEPIPKPTPLQKCQNKCDFTLDYTNKKDKLEKDITNFDSNLQNKKELKDALTAKQTGLHIKDALFSYKKCEDIGFVTKTSYFKRVKFKFSGKIYRLKYNLCVKYGEINEPALKELKLVSPETCKRQLTGGVQKGQTILLEGVLCTSNSGQSKIYDLDIQKNCKTEEGYETVIALKYNKLKMCAQKEHKVTDLIESFAKEINVMQKGKKPLEQELTTLENNKNTCFEVCNTKFGSNAAST